MTSELSPYLHFGHISTHQIFSEITRQEGWSPDHLAVRATGSRSGWWGTSRATEAFLDQVITWRELGFNFCEMRNDYDQFESLPAWALKTLRLHTRDQRSYVYTIARIGGKTGWYYGDWLWRARGLLDLLFGGAGMRRGRRDPDRLLPGDTLDFWRVEAIQTDSLLRLAAEMRLPGRAWLQFEVQPDGAGSAIRQTAIFDPAGVLGQLYWYLLFPIHQFIFAGMLRGIVDAMGESL